MRELPDLHKSAFVYKNRKRLQHDGGRAWIKNAQLHNAVSGINTWVETNKKEQEKKEEKQAD